MAADSPERITVAEYTGLLGLIQGMLSATETRILERLSDNSRIAAERWAKHDAEAARLMADWDRRFGALEKSVNDHHHADELEHITWDARMGPLRNTVRLVASNWKTIALALFALLGFMAVFLDIAARYLGVEA